LLKKPLDASLVEKLKKEGMVESVPLSLPDFTNAALSDHIYMDAMAFGMGSWYIFSLYKLSSSYVPSMQY
jgi:hypothetical protein